MGREAIGPSLHNAMGTAASLEERKGVKGRHLQKGGTVVPPPPMVPLSAVSVTHGPW